ncbi:MAG: PilZ domain-containing protein [Phycisphaerales bacterium]
MSTPADGSNASTNPVERRRFERFALVPGYTAVAVRRRGEGGPWHLGHVYDVSEGGVRFELDHAFEPGSIVEMKLDLPRSTVRLGFDADAADDEASVGMTARVVWCDQDSVCDAKLGVEVAQYASQGDRDRLVRHLTGGRFRRAA